MTKPRTRTAQQKLNNFLRSDEAKTYPLTSSSRLVLHGLASYCYYKNECNPSYASLMNYTQYSESYIKENINLLEMLGLLFVERKKGCRNKYFWNIPDIPEADIYRKKVVDKDGKSRNK